MTTLLRYPGGKKKLLKGILKTIDLQLQNSNRYIEPFLGGGSVALAVIKQYPNIKEVVLADLDGDLCCLWNSVLTEPEGLKRLIKEFTPTVDSFYNFKEQLATSSLQDPLEKGFKKLALHQMSYSGLGGMSGGPIGGESQKSKYSVGCRWSPAHLSKKIDEINYILKDVEFIKINGYPVNCSPFTDIIPQFTAPNSFTYLDPPYFVKGQELYLHGFDISEHLKLKECIDRLEGRMALSYDHCPEILGMYSKYKVVNLSVNYTINTSRNKMEILIYN